MWPFKKIEKRESGGDFSDAVVRLIEAQAAGTAADASSTAAVEAASGALSRAFATAEVHGEPWIKEVVTPAFMAQVGRDLIRNGDSMHVIRMSGAGEVRLIPASSWHWEGNHDPDSWTVRVTAYGPSTSTTWNLPAESVIFARWGSTPGQTYVGTGPLSWAHTTARLQSESERSLADEAQGPLAQLLAIPQDGGDGGGDDPLKMLKADISTARGKALLLETSNSGWGEGRASAPQRDWQASRLGPQPPDSMATIADQTFERVLAACGCSVAMFDDSDGTSKREAQRIFLHGTVRPLGRLLAAELSAKLDTDVALNFDELYMHDLAGRAQAFQKLVTGGVAVSEALATSVCWRLTKRRNCPPARRRDPKTSLAESLSRLTSALGGSCCAIEGIMVKST